MNKTQWHEGKIDIPVKDKNVVANYCLKAYETGSEYGINGGKISKLQIKIDGVTVVNYDRGWDIKPAADCQPALLAYCICLENYN